MSNALLVIPAYNESERLPRFLRTMLEAAEVSSIPLDILVVDDGSSVAHAAQVASEVAELQPLFKAQSLNLRLHRFERNQGKGAALRFAFSSQRENYEFLGFMDADGSTAFKEWQRLLAILSGDESLDGVFGSRFKALGYKVERSYRRFLAGRVFATLLSEMFKIPVYDSQCGAKVFRQRVLGEKLLKVCDDDRWLFDTQLLLYLHASGRSLLEVPVSWVDCAGSKVSLVRDSLKMFVRLFKIRRVFKSRLADF